MTVIIQPPKDSNGNPQPMVYDQDTGKVIVDSNGYVLNGGQRLVNIPSKADYVSAAKTQTSGIQEAMNYLAGNPPYPSSPIDTPTITVMLLPGQYNIYKTITPPSGFQIDVVSLARKAPMLVMQTATGMFDFTVNNNIEDVYFFNIGFYGYGSGSNTATFGIKYNSLTGSEIHMISCYASSSWSNFFDITISNFICRDLWLNQSSGVNWGTITAQTILSINDAEILSYLQLNGNTIHITNALIQYQIGIVSQNGVLNSVIDLEGITAGSNEPILSINSDVNSINLKDVAVTNSSGQALISVNSGITVNSIRISRVAYFNGSQSANYVLNSGTINNLKIRDIPVPASMITTSDISPVPTNPSVPSSGTAQENTNQFPVDVYIYGGDITEIQITRGGTAYTVLSVSTAIAMSGQAYKLNPGDSITITYSTAPSWEWLSD